MSKKMNKDIPVKPTDDTASVTGEEIPSEEGMEALEEGSVYLEPEEVDLRDERIIALEAIIEDLRDKHLRASAEAENIRRRAEKEKTDALKFGASRLARDLLPVADNLRRALATIDDATRASSGDLVTGLELTERELLAAFRRHEIVAIDPVGEKFNPNMHEAMAQIPGTGKAEGTVVDVIETGFQINGRLLRPARVAIATGAPDSNNGSPETS